MTLTDGQKLPLQICFKINLDNYNYERAELHTKIYQWFMSDPMMRVSRAKLYLAVKLPESN